MFKSKWFLAVSLIVALALVGGSFSPAQAQDAGTIVDIAVADGRFTTLVAALQAADLVETLSGEGPFTVFAPTDDAFAKLPEGTVEGLLEDIPALTDILLYHVVSGEVLAADVVELESAETVLGESVSIRVEDGNVYIDDAMVIITDIMADNGVIHVIDSVLLPGQEEAEEETEEMQPVANSIVDIAVADGRFDTLVAALQAADLAETLAGEGPFTVFAPTDAAFSRLPEGTVEALLNDIPALTDILLYHVVSGEVMAEQALELGEAETLQGQSIEIMFDEGNILIPGGLVYANDARIRITDIQASNGVIHVIDRVLLPEAEEESMGTIVDIAVADGRFETLVAALQAADLVETLSGEGPFTVFAPTDDAFAKLPEGTVEGLLEDIPALTDILLYHVVSGEVLAADVVELESAETVLGESVSIRVEDGNVYINDSMVILTDIMADNGVIHVIDTVLLPPAE